MQFELININSSNEENGNFSSPYVLNISNNTNIDKTITVFDAFNQIPLLNNPIENPIYGFSDSGQINPLIPNGEIGGKQSFLIEIGSNFFLVFWNGSYWQMDNDAHPIPTTFYALYLDTELPIGNNAQWVVVTPSSLVGFYTTQQNTIETSLPGITYADILQQSASKPFVVGKTYIYSDNVLQVNQTYDVIVRDANGNLTNEVQISASIDPYQKIANAITSYGEYEINGNTGIQFKTKANTSMMMLFYPVQIANLADELTDGVIEEDFDVPTSYDKEIVVSDIQSKKTTFNKKVLNKNNTFIYVTGAIVGAYLLNKLFKWV